MDAEGVCRAAMRQTPRTSRPTRRNVSGGVSWQLGYRLTAAEVAKDEAPSGMMARGHYDAVSKFVDDDKHDHLVFEWSFDIKKTWE